MPDYPATFFWKRKGSEPVHWHYMCESVPVRVGEHPRWCKADAPPEGREACPDCQERDRSIIFA